MSLIKAKFVTLDAQSMQDDGGAVAVKTAPDGGIERTADGVAIAEGGVAHDMLAESYTRPGENESITGAWEFAEPIIIASPTSGNHAANKEYVDLVVNGIRKKFAARAATTGALPACTYANGASGVGATLTGNANGALAAQDGVTLTALQQLLVKDQASAAQNGVYEVTTVGSGGAPFVLTRIASLDEATDFPSAYVFIEEGSTHADNGWICTTDAGLTVGTTAITWVQFTGAGQITAGAGLTKSGNTIDVVAGDASLTVNANSIQVHVDGSTIEVDAVNGVRVKASGIGTNELADEAVTFAKIQHIATARLLGRGSSGTGDVEPIQLGTNLSFDGTTLNATGSGGSTRRVETFTLDGTAISNKYVTLSNTPAAAGRVILQVKGAGVQHYGDDFEMDGGNPARVTWNGLGLDGTLASGDKLTVEYDT